MSISNSWRASRRNGPARSRRPRCDPSDFNACRSDRATRVSKNRPLGELEDQEERIEAARRNRRGDVIDEALRLELQTRDVQRHREPVATVVPNGALRQASLSAHRPPARYARSIPRSPMKRSGLTTPRSRIAPADECLHAGEAVGPKVDRWLVDEEELPTSVSARVRRTPRRLRRRQMGSLSSPWCVASPSPQCRKKEQ